MDMTNDKSGYVYVFSNEAMPGILKIGFTKTSDINQRLSQLYTTSVPVPFKCEYACKVANCSEVETALHKAFNDKRINQDREFFMLDASQPIAILKLLEKEQAFEDITARVQAENEKETDAMSKAANEKLRQRRPHLNFVKMGIPIGSELIFASGDDRKITAQVVGEKKVCYENETYSLTALTQKLLGTENAVYPTSLWIYNNKALDAYYNETYFYHEYNDTDSEE